LETNHQLANEGLALALAELEHPMASSHDPKSEFGRLNITSLHQHDLHQKTLVAPLKKIPAPLRLSSWKDERLPNLLWAALVAAHFPRDRVLNLFREITNIGFKLGRDKAPPLITHSALGRVPFEIAALVLDPVLQTQDTRMCLRALRLLSALPDAQYWEKLVTEPEEDDWAVLAKAVGALFDHQSQLATDVRWLKVAYALAIGQMVVPPEFVEQIGRHPNHGDQRHVRPSVRATEIAMGGTDDFSNALGENSFDHETFWRECLSKTPCLVSNSHGTEKYEVTAIFDEITLIYDNVAEHFGSTTRTTDIDARHDAAFGISLYALYLHLGMLSAESYRRPEGRFLLRSIAECFITLHYLREKDEPTIWLQYRNYGTGSAKLAFLKALEGTELPGFVELRELHLYANEDYWQEYVDIKLGAFANKNLRQMATDSGCKDVYDRFYDWTSAYTHANWSAVRDTVFVTCLNPLHRFHRIPERPKLSMPSTLEDASRLINRMLDDLNHLYPTIKARIGWHNRAEQRKPKREKA